MTEFLHSTLHITSHVGIKNIGAIFMSCVYTLNLLETSNVVSIKDSNENKNSLARKNVTVHTQLITTVTSLITAIISMAVLFLITKVLYYDMLEWKYSQPFATVND
jgi:hypothetical protein